MLTIFDVYEPTTKAKAAVCGHDAHGSTITELPNGEIMAVWYCGTCEKHPDVGIYTSRLAPGAQKWGPVSLLEKEANNKSEGNPVIYYDNITKRLWLFWVTMARAGYKRMPGGWSTCKMKCKHSDDMGHTWTQTRFLTKMWGRMTRNKPIRLSNGDVLFPIYSEWAGYKGNFLIATANEFAKGALECKWIKVGPVLGGIMQPTVVELDDKPGHLLAYFRTAKSGKFFPYMSISESQDFGRHWAPIWKGELYNPNAGNDMVKLQNGKIALAFNNSPTGRCPLSIALSEDGGKTWPYIQDLETDSTDGARYGYPGIIQAKDGSLYCSYTNRHGINIRVAHFDETWITNGK
jgi:predicted neuraminidase